MAFSSSYTQTGLFCCPYKDLVRKHSKHYRTCNSVIFTTQKYPNTSLCSFIRPPKRFIGMTDQHRWPIMDKNWRSIVARSELADTGSPGASYQLSEFNLGSKIRGICFYSVTSFIAIFLFMVMLVSHPFVLLRDKYQRKFHHFIAKIWASDTLLGSFSRLQIETFVPSIQSKDTSDNAQRSAWPSIEIKIQVGEKRIKASRKMKNQFILDHIYFFTISVTNQIQAGN